LLAGKEFSMTPKQKEIAVRFIVESDAIEAIYSDELLVRRQIDQDWQEGHVGVLLILHELATHRMPLTHEIVCAMQGLITAEQHLKQGGARLKPEYVGQYRKIAVNIGGKAAPAFEKVPALMDEWLKQANSIPLSHSYSVNHADLIRMIAQSHFQFETIHPFADGNGRSGRAFVYYLYRRLGFRPFYFSAVLRFNDYYRCFADPAMMEDYFLKRSK